MLKLAIISDLHLGFAFGTEREEDSFVNAEKAFKIALEEDPNLILIPGDIFHNKIPRPEVLAKAIELFSIVNNSMKKRPTILLNVVKDGQVKELKQFIPPIICIWGTHERRHEHSINPVQILQKAGLIHCLQIESALIESGYDKIGVHGLSGVPEIYAIDIMKQWAPKPFENVPNIMMVHQNFMELLPVPEALTYADLPKGFDLFALGHIHWASEAKHPTFDTPIIIPGSTVKTQLTKIESEKPKGFYMVELSRQKGNITFMPFSTRPLFHEKLSVTNQRPNEIAVLIIQKIQDHLKKEYVQKPMLKIKLEGTLADNFSPADLNIGSVIKDYKDKIILKIDKSKLTSKSFEQQSKLLAELKTKKLSIDQLGLELLKNNLKTEVDLIKLEAIFDLLAENELEQAEELL